MKKTDSITEVQRSFIGELLVLTNQYIDDFQGIGFSERTAKLLIAQELGDMSSRIKIEQQKNDQHKVYGKDI